MKNFFRQTGRFTAGVKGFGGGAEIPNVLTITGESFNNPNINNAALNDAVSRQAIDIVGRHTYGTFRKYRYANALDHPTDPKEVWMTEHNINSGNESLYPLDSTWNYVWKFMNDIDLSIRLTDESAFIWWAAKRFYSFLGDGRYGTKESAIQPRGYGISHYAKFAKETWRVAVSATGKTAGGQNLSNSNFNSAVDDVNGTDVKATAFVSPDGNTISLVLFTATTPAGAGGINMGTVEIRLPGDFIIREAAAMRSRRDNYAVWEDVHINENRTSALVALPASNILSLRFTK
jgi:O-glycosyl hydrolase